MNLTDYKFFETMLRRESGLALTPEKIYLLEARLNPVAQRFGMAGLDALVQDLRRHAELQRAVVEAMTTNETFFFREPETFYHLQNTLLPAIVKRKKTLKIWSAGCATGQEPYSIAMMLADMQLPAELSWQVIATDISDGALAVARGGVYSQMDVQRGLPARNLLKHFSKNGDKWAISGALREKVRFMHHNLLDSSPPGADFDVIFCRNVMIYFSQTDKQAFLARLSLALPPGGLLVIGGGEMIAGLRHPFSPAPGMPAIWRNDRA